MIGFLLANSSLANASCGVLELFFGLAGIIGVLGICGGIRIGYVQESMQNKQLIKIDEELEEMERRLRKDEAVLVIEEAAFNIMARSHKEP